MKRRAWAILVGCAILWSQATAVIAAEEADKAKLQGKWIVESFDYNGDPVEMMQGAEREFKDDKYSLTPKAGDVITGSYKLDASQKPKQIDLVVGDRTLQGIYELDGEVLKMAYSLDGNQRPTELASKPGSGVVLVVHKRAK